MNKFERNRAISDGIAARQFLGRLYGCGRSGARYLDSEMEAARLKLSLRPDFKNLLQEVAGTNGQNMADFIREATEQRMKQVLEDRIALAERIEKEEAEREAA